METRRVWVVGAYERRWGLAGRVWERRSDWASGAALRVS
jgi:hypothetical protein